MDRNSMSMPLMIALVLVLGITVISFAEAQAVPTCAEQLSPCLNYITSTNPPNTCCNPLKDIYTTQPTCLCKLLFTPGILEGLGTNTTQAVKGCHLCGVNIDISICKAALSALPPSSSVPPPATPGGDEGNADRVAFSGLSFLLLFWASVLFN